METSIQNSKTSSVFTEAQRQRLLELSKTSTQSQKAFCREYKLAPCTLRRWQKRQRGTVGVLGLGHESLIELKPESMSASNESMELRITGMSLTIKGYVDARWLVTLMKGLQCSD